LSENTPPSVFLPIYYLDKIPNELFLIYNYFYMFTATVVVIRLPFGVLPQLTPYFKADFAAVFVKLYI
jgi:hypothetical protein